MSKRHHTLLLWLGVLLALLAVAPLQAAERPQAWLRFSLGGAALTLCAEPGTAAALAQSPSLPALAAAARAPGATRCKAAHQVAAQPSAPRAGLVIDFGDGRVQSFCIDLGAGGEMSGEELLRASQLPVVIEYSGLGGAVCKVGGTGTNFPDESCFARCTLRPGEPCLYWAYSRLAGGAWQTSQMGASSTTIHAGEVDGWAWGQGSSGSGAQPALRTFEQICAAATATPSASPTPTASATRPPQAQPSAPARQFVTVVPSATPARSPTATSTPQLALALPSHTPAAPTLAPAAPGNTPAPARTAVLASAPSVTPAPPPTATPVPSTTPARDLRVQIPMAQKAELAAEPVAAPSASATASPPQVPTSVAPGAAAPNASPTRSYPIFGILAALLVLAWALLRRRRA